MKLVSIALLALLGSASISAAADLVVGSFNAESGSTAKPDKVAKRIAASGHVHIWGLSEVSGDKDATTFAEAASANSKSLYVVELGTTGKKDRLAIIYDKSVLTLRKRFELRTLIFKGCGERNARVPLVAEFQHLESGRVFWFMVNHLQRGDADYRHCQARQLNDWVKTNTRPMIAVGDYNFDWSISKNGTERDDGFDLMLEGGRFEWIRPKKLVKTQCSFNSVLDFVFVSGRARHWEAESEILFPEPEYCTSNPDEESDHRPVLARFSIAR